MKKMKDAMKDVLVLLISVAMIFTMGNPLPFAFSDDEKNLQQVCPICRLNKLL